MDGHAVIVVRDLDLLAGLGELLAEEGVTATLVPREADIPAALQSLGPAAACAVLLVDDSVDVEGLAAANLPVIALDDLGHHHIDHLGTRVEMPIDPDELLHALSEALAARSAKIRRAAAGLGCAAPAGQP